MAATIIASASIPATIEAIRNQRRGARYRSASAYSPSARNPYMAVWKYPARIIAAPAMPPRAVYLAALPSSARRNANSNHGSQAAAAKMPT